MPIKSIEHIILGRHRRQSPFYCHHFSAATGCGNNDEDVGQEGQQNSEHYSIPVRSARRQLQYYGQTSPLLWNSLMPKCRACDASTDENCVQLRITIRNCNDEEEGGYWTRLTTPSPAPPIQPPTPPYLPYLPPPTAPLPPPPLIPYPSPPPLPPLPSLPAPLLPLPPPPCIAIGSPCPTNAFLITVRPVQSGGIPLSPPPLPTSQSYGYSPSLSSSHNLVPFSFHSPQIMSPSQSVAPSPELIFHPPAMPLQPSLSCQHCCRKCSSLCWPSFEVLGCDENLVPDFNGYAENG